MHYATFKNGLRHLVHRDWHVDVLECACLQSKTYVSVSKYEFLTNLLYALVFRPLTGEEAEKLAERWKASKKPATVKTYNTPIRAFKVTNCYMFSLCMPLSNHAVDELYHSYPCMYPHHS